MKKVVIWFLIGYIGLLNPVSNLVLCWGDEGHVAVESKIAGEICCAHTELSAPAGRHSFLPVSPELPCWDIPLSFEKSSDAKPASNLLAHLEHAALVPEAVLPILAVRNFVIRGPFHTLPPPVLTHLTTIQLII
ncbi:MAG: hypothetical protein RBU29_06315 [bacterium]|jgi:hypothetical protein|nr:hypothetical protein [bacterium]